MPVAAAPRLAALFRVGVCRVRPQAGGQGHGPTLASPQGRGLLIVPRSVTSAAFNLNVACQLPVSTVTSGRRPAARRDPRQVGCWTELPAVTVDFQVQWESNLPATAWRDSPGACSP